MSVQDPFAALVDTVAGRVLDQVRAELQRDESTTEPRLIRADRTGLGSRQVRRLAAAGKLAASKVGKHLFVRASDLARFTEAHRVPVRQAPQTRPTGDSAPSEIDGVAALADELDFAPVKSPARRRATGTGRG